MRTILETMHGTFSGVAYTLTVAAGLLTITVERYLYRRRDYKREAKLSAIIGWTYVLGGTLLYLLLAIVSRQF